MNYNFTQFIETSTIKKTLQKTLLLVCLVGGLSLTASAQCVPQYDFGCNSDDDINDFELVGQGASTISDMGTGCATSNGYDDRTTIVPPVDLMQGGTYNGMLTTDYPGGDEWFKIWIDFNDNNVFEDPSEAVTAVLGPAIAGPQFTFSLTLPISAATGTHRMRVRLAFGQSAAIDPCALYSFGETHDYLVNVLPAPPCAGQPSITSIIPAGPINSCAGASQTLSLTLPVAGGYLFQWQNSTDGGLTWNNIGPNSTIYTFTVTGSALYRAYVVCTNSNLADTSAAVSVNAVPPVYASLPFFEDFETWNNYCALSDIPSSGTVHWTNNPPSGDNSWRREDEGWTANWSASWGSYFPTSVSGIHSARFPSANGLVSGNLDLYLDCSQQTGGKALYFYHINDGNFNWGDSLAVFVSTDGGSTFSQIASLDTAQNWKKHGIPFNSNSAQTIIRFNGKVINWDGTDIGVDSVYVVGPCTGAPVAGTISPAGPIMGCPGSSYTLTTMGASMSGDLDYLWQQSMDGGVTWINMTGGAMSFTTPTLYDTAQFRLILTCNGSGLSDTTAAIDVYISEPVYAPIPYFQDFENWISYCANSDIPDGNDNYWINTPSTGDASWRRDDEGWTANWSSTWGTFFPTSISGNHSARFCSTNGISGGTLDLLVDCSQQPGNKGLFFYFMNDGLSTIGDSLLVWMSTDAGATFTQIASLDTALVWKKQGFQLPSTSAQTIIRFEGQVFNWDFTDIGVDSLYIAPPCSGAPVAGTLSPAGPITGCPGNVYAISALGSTMAGNLNYQWQASTDGGLTWTNVGSNSINFNTPPLYDTIAYRFIVTCVGSALADTSAPVEFNISSPVYATLPYAEDFENWINFCDLSDVPSMSWLNKPSTGDMSWRRDDEGITANWFSPNNGFYMPSSYTGSHSARFHSWNSWGSTGDLDLFVDCSVPGTKELQFHYINTNGWDELQVWLSEDGGATFNQLTSVFNASNWTQEIIPINSNSNETIIRFRGISDFSDDIGLDNVKVLLPCTGTPIAGTIDQQQACAGTNFTITTTGTTLAAGLAYQWEESADGISWNAIPGAVDPVYTTSITTPTWYRLIVTCTNSSVSDTTAAQMIDTAAFYHCYCQSSAMFSQGPDIGNFNIRKLPGNLLHFNNGIAAPLTNNPDATKVYTDYTGLGAIELYRDSAYQFTIRQINKDTFTASVVAIYIDLDRNGVYHPQFEKIMQAPISNTSTPAQQVSGTFTIPGNAEIGITGMRVVLMEGMFAFPDPCLLYNYGETEDYLVQISYPPCDGATNPGVAHISDTLLCPGFPITLTDTTHEKFRSGLTWIWQSSTDGVNWTDIAGTDSMNIITQTTGPVKTWYRLRMHCEATNTSTYSNEVYVNIKFAFFCYCESYANGGSGDVSDNGAFSIGNYVFNGGGPHLNNPVATKPYSNFNYPVMTLNVDSTYPISVYHIIRNANHQDAKYTLFIDYNNNFVYEPATELVWTGYSSFTDVFVNGTVTIPSNAVTNVITGMRLIINNDTGPNVPSDEACGPYLSGETEDYAVKILPKGVTNVKNVNGLSSFELYPNPTTGRVTVTLNGTGTNERLELRVFTITGQQVYYQRYQPSGNALKADFDLGVMPRGVYFVELSGNGQKAIKKLVLN